MHVNRSSTGETLRSLLVANLTNQSVCTFYLLWMLWSHAGLKYWIRKYSCLWPIVIDIHCIPFFSAVGSSAFLCCERRLGQSSLCEPESLMLQSLLHVHSWTSKLPFWTRICMLERSKARAIGLVLRTECHKQKLFGIKRAKKPLWSCHCVCTQAEWHS